MEQKSTKDMMTAETFDLATVQYGLDVAAWPLEARRLAEAYLTTAAGKAHHAELSAFDADMAGLVAAAAPAPSAAFLGRLASIPAQHEQSLAGVFGWLRRLLMPGSEGFAPKVLVQQLAVVAIFLSLGVAAGMSGFTEVTTTTPEVDISDGWFSLTLDFEHSEDALEG